MTEVFAIAPILDETKTDENIVKKFNEYLVEDESKAEARSFPFVDHKDPLKMILKYYQQPIKTLQEDGLFGFSIKPRYGYSKDKEILFLDIASLVGPTTVPTIAKSPLISSSNIIGTVLKKIVRSETQKIVFMNTYSIATDLGLGMFEELGMTFYNAQGRSFEISGGKIGQISSFSYEGLDKKWLNYEYLILSDKKELDLLVGEEGISYQNQALTGASDEIVKVLDRETEKCIQTVSRLLNKPDLLEPLASVGNGLSFACLAFTRHVKVMNQLKAFVELTDFEANLKQVDYFIIPEKYTTFRQMLTERKIPTMVIKTQSNTTVAENEVLLPYFSFTSEDMLEIFDYLKVIIRLLYFRGR
ncbi:glycerate kinase [Enterococcus pseudoavium]|uniref:Glycerate kinase n=1 Tax=Enterococcus pseudoavium TaxID=44007 RepID=A0ABU3FJU6_9ENTE|nr:glycerate kinase [Enterococcus pseudoavium]MDT2753753.1 glycerate kinase [Enterococcus pseudoavium]MDT2771336.1 glycerate kinase [Enterococcus pseudoavium]